MENETNTETMRDVASLMVGTLALAANHPDKVELVRTELHRPNVLKAVVNCHPDDVALILGGRGTNAKAVRELGVYACPPGHFVELHVEAPDLPPADRRKQAFGRCPELGKENVALIKHRVAKWHQLLGEKEPEITHEPTKRADVFIVHSEQIPGQVMSNLRKVLGWCCKIKGRYGFIEWEATES